MTMKIADVIYHAPIRATYMTATAARRRLAFHVLLFARSAQSMDTIPAVTAIHIAMGSVIQMCAQCNRLADEAAENRIIEQGY